MFTCASKRGGVRANESQNAPPTWSENECIENCKAQPCVVYPSRQVGQSCPGNVALAALGLALCCTAYSVQAAGVTGWPLLLRDVLTGPQLIRPTHDLAFASRVHVTSTTTTIHLHNRTKTTKQPACLVSEARITSYWSLHKKLLSLQTNCIGLLHHCRPSERRVHPNAIYACEGMTSILPCPSQPPSTSDRPL